MGTSIAARIGLANTAAEHLAPGEEFIKVDDLESLDFWKPRRAIKDVTAPGAAGPFGSRQIGAGITNRRLLLFALGGLLHAEVKSVLLEASIADVQAITCESHWWKSTELSLAFGAAEYPFLIAHIGRGQKMAQALEAAQRAQA
jgi:hypothetical protein